VTPGIAAMLLGVFVVPTALLWLGHRLRRRSARARAVFWGAVIGHIAAMACAHVALMPAEEWSPDDRLRGALGLWSFLVLPLLGGAVGWMKTSRDRGSRLRGQGK
jgi:hypothetical protein